MKLVNESLKNLKIMIGKEIAQVGADGSIEIDGKDAELVQSLLNSGFEEVKSAKAEKAEAPKKAPPVKKEEPKKEEPKSEEKSEEPKSLGEKVRNRFKKD